MPLGARGWIGDGIRGALISADGTIDWYAPSGLSGPPACWSLLDPAGGAVRVGPVRTGTGASRRLPAYHQAYRRESNVFETVLDDGAGGRVSILDLLPWPGPGLSVPGLVIRVVTALAGPVEVEVEVLPGGAWRPPREVAGFDGGLVVDDLVVRTGFSLRFEPLGRDAPRWRGSRRLEPGAAFVVTLERVGDERLVIDRHRPGGPAAGRRSATASLRTWLSEDAMLAPGGGGAQPAGGAFTDGTGRGAVWSRYDLTAPPDRQ